MAQVELPNGVTAGIAKLPARLQQPNTIDWLTILLMRNEEISDLAQAYVNYLLTWDLPGVDTPDFILDAIGKLYGQPRPDGADNEIYRKVLIVRRVARMSSGTQPDVRRVVKTLGDLGGGAMVAFQIPHTVIVVFANFANLDEQGLSIDVVSSLLLDTIGDVDRLQIWDAVGNVFTWDTEGKGWLQGVWATPLFDSED